MSTRSRSISVCIVNTNGRELLLRLPGVGVPASARQRDSRCWCSTTPPTTAPPPRSGRVRRPGRRSIELDRRRGKPENDSDLMTRARGRYCLLLNEDSELTRGRRRRAARRRSSTIRGAAAAGARLLDAQGVPQPSAWRFPGLADRARRRAVPAPPADRPEPRRAARARWTGCSRRACSCARRPSSRSGRSTRSSSSTPTRSTGSGARATRAGRCCTCRQRCDRAPRAALHGARRAAADRRVRRNRDRYVRKHPAAPRRWRCGSLTAFAYALRALAALVLPGHSARPLSPHAYHSLFPAAGEGLREAAEAYNRSSSDRGGPR